MAYEAASISATPLPDLPCADVGVHLAPRLALAADLARHGSVDGGWWPRSRDAARELVELVTILAGRLGRVVRLTVDASDWDDIPRRSITVGGHVVRIGAFPTLNHMIIVTKGRGEQFLLLVVPPEAEPASAESALERAAAGAGSAAPRQILADSDMVVRNPRALRLVPAGQGVMGSVTVAQDDTWGEPAEISRWADDGGPPSQDGFRLRVVEA